MRHLEGLRPFGIALDGRRRARPARASPRRPTGPAYEAARAALASAWGGATVIVATGGSIPLVNALQAAAPNAEIAAARHHRRLRQHPRAERARAARRVRARGRGGGGLLRALRGELRRSSSRGRAGVSAPEVTADAEGHSFLERMLDGIERFGNKMPNPAILFLLLCVIVIVALAGPRTGSTSRPPTRSPSRRLWSPSRCTTGGRASRPTSAPYVPEPAKSYEIKTETSKVQGLLTGAGIRFLFTSFVSNFRNFAPVAIILVVMIGVGLAEAAGLIGGADTQARRRVVEEQPDVHHRAGRDHLEHRVRCRLPGADTPGGRRLPERRQTPARGHRGRLRRRRGGLRR